MKKLLGFTLAEVLITLAIIGIVASMTIPTLMNQANDIELKVAWKKAFSVLSQAHALLIADNIMPVSSSTSYAYPDALADKLKVSKRCTVSTSGCWHAVGAVYSVANKPVTFVGNGGDMVYHINDGMMMYVYNGGFSPVSPLTAAMDNNSAGFMIIDVNGFKKPNRMGYDMYSVEYYGNALIASGAANSHYTETSGFSSCDKTSASTSWNNGLSCSSKALLGISY